MKTIRLLPGLLILFMMSCDNPIAVQQGEHEDARFDVTGKKSPVEETAGNNLSYLGRGNTEDPAWHSRHASGTRW